MPLLITEDQVREHLSMERAVAAVEAAMAALALGTAQNLPRRRVRLPGITLHVMSAGMVNPGYLGVKAYTTTSSGNQFVVLLFARESGDWLATIEANALGQIRTGAASGVATRYMARQASEILGVIGCGFQARTQIEAICRVRPIRNVLVYCRDEERRKAFAESLQDDLAPVAIHAVDTAEACVRPADVIVTVTTSGTPVMRADWIRSGAHLNAAGSNALTRAELGLDTVSRCDRVVVDSLEQARLECGDLLPAIERNLISWEQVTELSDVVAGRIPGRERPEEVTLFESHGLALWDVAVAGCVYEQLRSKGNG